MNIAEAFRLLRDDHEGNSDVAAAIDQIEAHVAEMGVVIADILGERHLVGGVSDETWERARAALKADSDA